jgi:tRNA pseudouridine55 synthase
MDGLLIIDKPQGPTSHDVVARMRRVLGERRIGHTGTLDPLATGVLPLVLGRATRLARFLSSADKSYEAVLRLGFSTDTYDADGTPAAPPHGGPMPDRAALEQALAAFRGTFEQRPPAFSAKKIGGRRSHALARANARLEPRARDERPVQPHSSTVTVTRLELGALEHDRVTLRIDCSAGFYVRSLAHDLGVRLGVGAHLTALRRTRSGDCTLAEALPLDAAERDPAAAIRQIVPLDRMLPAWPAVELTAHGVRDAGHGRMLGADAATGRHAWLTGARVRLVDERGRLVGLAEPAAAGLLHPFVVFG